jgi:hypothetical protein
VSIALSVLGVLCCLTGGVWIFQGIGVLGGSFMTGQALWAWMGLVTLAGGLAFLALGRRTARGS